MAFCDGSATPEVRAVEGDKSPSSVNAAASSLASPLAHVSLRRCKSAPLGASLAAAAGDAW